jgi:hypothetical protein
VYAAYNAQEPERHYGRQCTAWSAIYAYTAKFIARNPANLLTVLEGAKKDMDVPCKGCRKSMADCGDFIDTGIKCIPKFSALR